MKGLFRFLANRHALANIVVIMAVLLGLNTLTRIKRDMFPKVDFGELTITTVYPGGSPEDVELNVTNEIEDEIKEVSGIDRMTSVSMEDISVVYVRIDPDEDQERVKRDIRSGVDRVTDLPPEVTEAPLITEWNTDIFPVIEIGLAGDVPYTELREHARRMEKQLKTLPSVASLEKYGYRDREIQVEVSPAKMREYQLPFREIVTAVAARNIRVTAGALKSDTDEQQVVTMAEFEDPMEVGDVIVRTTFDGPVIRIRDVAVVRDDFEEERVLSRMEGRTAISFFVNKKSSADVIRTADEVKKLADDFEAALPDGVDVLYADDMSYYVRNRLHILVTNGLIGLCLVVVTLSLFLSFRSAFWVAVSIPVTLLATIALMPVFGVYLEIVSLAVLIQLVGIVVDDAIIVAENIHKRREMGEPPLEAAVTGLHDVFWPVVATIATSLLAFIPLFFMSGMMGKFVYVVPLVMCLALGLTLFLDVATLPAHLIWGLKNGGAAAKDRTARSWFHPVRRFYRGWMRYVITLRYLFVFFSVVLLAGSLWYAATYMDFVLFPPEAADTFYLLVELPTGSSLEHTSEKVKELEATVAALPDEELDSFVARIGNQGNFAFGENDNWAVLRVNLTPYAERTRTADEIVEDLRRETDRLAGFENVVYYIDSGGPPVGRPVTVRVVGSDDRMRKALADSVVAFLARTGGAKDIDRDDKPGKDQVRVEIDHEHLARVGATVADVAQNARIALDGEVATSVRYGDEDVDFRVRLVDEARGDLRYVERLVIPNARGRLITLGDVANLQRSPGPGSYSHYDGERAITVTSDYVKDATTPTKIASAVVDHFDMENDWPGMRLVIGGEAQEMDESMQSLFRAFIIAVIGIYFILVLLFNSTAQPLVVLAAVPFGVMGVIWAFALHGMQLGFLAMMGTVGLCGVVVNDSLVLVNHINDLRRRSTGTDLREVVATASADRLRPVLLTSFTTIVGVTPLVYGIGGSDPFIVPMVLALGYGVMFATPLTLAMIPCLYFVGEDLKGLPRRLGRVFRRVDVPARHA